MTYRCGIGEGMRALGLTPGQVWSWHICIALLSPDDVAPLTKETRS